MTLSLEKLQQVVQNATAFRCRLELQPAGGRGTKVFPPTYEGGLYAIEERRLPNDANPVRCVLLDSVQSQANRMEDALQQAVDRNRLTLPIIEVDFTRYFPGTDLAENLRLIEPIGKVSSLQAPHRIVDAILRDSLVDENGSQKAFRSANPKHESTYGKRLREASARNATPLFELCPTALLFGMWDSTGPKGGLGAKVERALVSEIIGINAVLGAKTSSRIDPLGIQLKAGPLYKTPEDAPFGWTLTPEKAVIKTNKSKTGKEEKGPAKLGEDGRPSEANHGNVTPSISKRDRDGAYLGGGVTIEVAEQTIVLSLPALRRLRFPLNGRHDDHVDAAAQTVLAALGLCAAVLAAEAGLDLRSRCLLWPTEPLRWEILGKPGHIEADLSLSAEAAVDLFNAAVTEAKKLGLPWLDQPLRLTPSDDLVKLVVKSQHLAKSKTNEGDE
ncbi:type I-U CRISPR-associated protein Cas7 [Chloracidobacterium validum]|uniref:Type I-U CRISPR-associated protein Cas7 n=1 Tax=Chloracidobacterium validum TaxID=2821543 RepID=A0ABX8BDL1_9BACT|nr:type I-U CRISPR-associated RAMP protein Csb1/Cas7u [Chloracidobacterium validum]QUW04502.1 type I-U CRISPR-associated protein Cas7 [Chloracidobacterium validum]